MIDVNNFKWRCHNLHLLVSKKKPDEILETAKKEIIRMYISETLGREKDIHSKYLEKGIECEEPAITMLSLHTGRYFIKNEERFSNDYISGEPDVIEEEFIHDTKCSFDIHTHLVKIMQGIDEAYYWQGQGYMQLFPKVKEFRIHHCLIDTPDFMIENEIRRLIYTVPPAQRSDAENEIRRTHKYSDLPSHIPKRIEQVVYRNQSDIDKIPAMVEKGRRFLDNFQKTLLEKTPSITLI